MSDPGQRPDWLERHRDELVSTLQGLVRIPSAVFGPGDCTVAHGSNEQVAVAELLRAARMLLATVLAWCGASR